MPTGQVNGWDFQATRCPECKRLVRAINGSPVCECVSKECRDCNRRLPLTEEYFYSRGVRVNRRTGKEVTYWDAYCRRCRRKRTRERMQARRKNPRTLEEDRAYSREKRREYLRRFPERNRETNKRQWEKIKNDPALYEEYLLTRRADFLKLKEFDPAGYVALRQDARINPGTERASRHKSTAVGAWKPGQERVDLKPFRDWIRETFPDKPIPFICQRLGLEDRVVRNVIDPAYPHQMDLNIIDRALVFFGRPDILNDLYPLREENGHDGNYSNGSSASRFQI